MRRFEGFYLAGWICEQFVPQAERMRALPLLDKYGVPVFGPAITLLDATGQKIAGPFESWEVRSLARHLEPPPVMTAEEIAKGKRFAIFDAQDVDVVKETPRRLVAMAPFLTVTRYANLGGEHQFQIKEIGLDRFNDEKGGFHAVYIYASGPFEPPLKKQAEPVVLLDGVFYQALGGRVMNPETKGVGAVLVRQGDSWLRIGVDKKEQLDALKKALEAARK